MAEPTRGYLVAPGGGRVLFEGGLGATLLVPGAITAGGVAVVEHTLAPGLLGAPPHCHEREDEISCILSGTLTVQVADELFSVGPGGCLVKPRGLFHAFWNAGTEPVRFLELISPAGFEGYFAEVGALWATGSPTLAEVEALAARYALTFDLAGLDELLARHGIRAGG